MKIPSSFKLMGQTVKVKFVDNVHYREDGIGIARYRENEIILQKSSPQIPISDEAQEHNFLHELFHFVLYWAGEDEFSPPLHKREYFVDRLAGLVHQVIKTAEYEK